MEQELLSNFELTLKNQTKFFLKPFSIARSLIINPSTTDQTISSIIEGLFLSLCFGSSVPARHRLLQDAEKFDVRPSILLTVFLGFTKDPYPYVRKAALNGLIGLCNRVVVEDRGMIEGCYLSGVELLSDTEECVRCSAVRMVSEWGKLFVSNCDEKSKRESSDTLYVQDEPDVLSVIFELGRNHGSFTVNVTEKNFSEMEPCSASNWDFNSSRTAAMLTLAISVPLSQDMQQHLYIIAPSIFSYAVTMLGRISSGLTEVMDRNTLLSYLSHCSSSTGPHHLECEDDLATEISGQITVCHVAEPLQPHDKEYNDVKFVLANIAEIWQLLIKLGCTSELLTTLRQWKEELTTHITDSRHPSSILTFALQYLHVVKLLSKAWWHVLYPLDFIYNNVRYTRAEVEIQDNDWLNPVLFEAGLPVGIPLKIKLHNIPVETKLWLKMSRSKDVVHYVFIDLKEFEGCDEIREFRFLAPFYNTPKVDSFVLVLSTGMECLTEKTSCFKGYGPSHELVFLCKEKQVFLSIVRNT